MKTRQIDFEWMDLCFDLDLHQLQIFFTPEYLYPQFFFALTLQKALINEV